MSADRRSPSEPLPQLSPAPSDSSSAHRRANVPSERGGRPSYENAPDTPASSAEEHKGHNQTPLSGSAELPSSKAASVALKQEPCADELEDLRGVENRSMPIFGIPPGHNVCSYDTSMMSAGTRRLTTPELGSEVPSWHSADTGTSERVKSPTKRRLHVAPDSASPLLSRLGKVPPTQRLPQLPSSNEDLSRLPPQVPPWGAVFAVDAPWVPRGQCTHPIPPLPPPEMTRTYTKLRWRPQLVPNSLPECLLEIPHPPVPVAPSRFNVDAPENQDHYHNTRTYEHRPSSYYRYDYDRPEYESRTWVYDGSRSRTYRSQSTHAAHSTRSSRAKPYDLHPSSSSHRRQSLSSAERRDKRAPGYKHQPCSYRNTLSSFCWQAPLIYNERPKEKCKRRNLIGHTVEGYARYTSDDDDAFLHMNPSPVVTSQPRERDRSLSSYRRPTLSPAKFTNHEATLPSLSVKHPPQQPTARPKNDLGMSWLSALGPDPKPVPLSEMKFRREETPRAKTPVQKIDAFSTANFQLPEALIASVRPLERTAPATPPSDSDNAEPTTSLAEGSPAVQRVPTAPSRVAGTWGFSQRPLCNPLDSIPENTFTFPMSYKAITNRDKPRSYGRRRKSSTTK